MEEITATTTPERFATASIQAGKAGGSAEVAPQLLTEVPFSQRLREIARQELNWLGVITGLAEPLPLNRR